MAQRAKAQARREGDGRKLAEIIAEQIERDIVDRGWPVGTVLGSEAELLERYGVSRAVLREAVRIVEHHYVAVMRRGPGGGLLVTEPDVRAAVQAVALQLRYQDIEPHHVYESRVALELNCVRMAAERIDRAGIARLRDFSEHEEQLVKGSLTEHTHDFHLLVADLTGNPAMRLFVQILAELTAQQSVQPASPDDAARVVHHTHARIAEAIIAKDPERAARRMQRHLDAIAKWLTSLQSRRTSLRRAHPG